jgi:hypothetical protein
VYQLLNVRQRNVGIDNGRLDDLRTPVLDFEQLVGVSNHQVVHGLSIAPCGQLRLDEALVKRASHWQWLHLVQQIQRQVEALVGVGHAYQLVEH